MTDITTIKVPYIPGMNGEPETPQYFKEREPVMFEYYSNDFELHEILGSRLTLIDGEWSQTGYHATYRRKESR